MWGGGCVGRLGEQLRGSVAQREIRGPSGARVGSDDRCCRGDGKVGADIVCQAARSVDLGVAAEGSGRGVDGQRLWRTTEGTLVEPGRDRKSET